MIKKKRKYGIFISLFTIFFFGFVVRIYTLSSLPKILNRDEAALAYNAYLLKQTGKDEWGQSWPMTLKSFGDYKLPGYPLLLVIFFSAYEQMHIPIFNDGLVRLPSALAGSILILVSYFFGQIFFKPFKKKTTKKTYYFFSLLFSLTIATSPALIYFSRIAFEANVALTLFIASITCLWFETKNNNQRLILDLFSLFLMICSVFTYNTPLVLLPFIILTIPFRSDVFDWKNWMLPVTSHVIIFIVGFLILLPVTQQKSGISIFTDELHWTKSIEYRQQFSNFWQPLFGNKYVYYSTVIIQNYIHSVSSQFLLHNTDGHPWQQVPGEGHVYPVILLFGWVGVIFGLILLLKNVFTFSLYQLKLLLSNSPFSQIDFRKSELLLFYLFVISLIPAVITVDAPHPTRSLFFFVLFNLAAVKGVKIISSQWQYIHSTVVVSSIFITMLIISSFSYLYHYFLVFPHQHPSKLQVGFDIIIKKVNQSFPEKNIAIVDNEGFHYILTAWYLQIPADTYFDSIIMQEPDKIGFHYGQQLDRYHFIGSIEDKSNSETVVVTWTKEKDWQVKTF